MANLLKETLELMKSTGKTEAEILWVGSRDGSYAITWSEFKCIADIDYYEGYGGQEIAEDLVIVGKGFWFERQEYDGSEWWELKTCPKKKSSPQPFKKVKGYGWASIKAINEAAEDE